MFRNYSNKNLIFNLLINLKNLFFYKISFFWTLFLVTNKIAFSFFKKVISFLARNNQIKKTLFYVLFYLTGIFLIIYFLKLSTINYDEILHNYWVGNFLSKHKKIFKNLVDKIFDSLAYQFLTSSIYKIYQANFLIHLNQIKH